MGGGGGGGGRAIAKIQHSETLLPGFLDPKKQFSRQGWSSLKFSALKFTQILIFKK